MARLGRDDTVPKRPQGMGVAEACGAGRSHKGARRAGDPLLTLLLAGGTSLFAGGERHAQRQTITSSPETPDTAYPAG